MIFKKFRKRKIKNANFFVEPDEVFLDSKNFQNFNQQQFEGRIEKPISKYTIWSLSIFFITCAVLFSARLAYLQIQKGQTYFDRSENNTLKKQIIFADRGIIYDRNKVELVWNKKTGDSSTQTEENNDFSTRSYLTPGFAHLLGYVSYPAKDKTGNYWQPDFKGKDGLEKEYNDKLQGENGTKIVETNARKKVQSENTINAPQRGADLVTTVDSRIQAQLFTFIKKLSESNLFKGGAGVIMNVNTGEVITSVSFPEYDSEILSLGKDVGTIKGYLTDKRNVFMDKNISGLYVPGSIVKPFFALAALNEGVIDPYKKILSTGSISIQNPYFPDQKTIFKDWRAQGWVDMRQALAVSSDVYFYEIGGGYEGQKGLGINNIEKYAKIFGIGGEKTNVDLPDEAEGTIPSPEWKVKKFPKDPWRIGDTYHTAIGQYGFQVTPLQMARGAGAIANYGKLVTPHFILGDKIEEDKVTQIDIKKEYFDVVHEGMRQSVLVGTSVALNVPYVHIASKTGTAQLGVAKNKVNSWVMGFFPYENPQYSFVILMEAGPSTNGVGAPFVMRELLDWMSINTPEYFK